MKKLIAWKWAGVAPRGSLAFIYIKLDVARLMGKLPGSAKGLIRKKKKKKGRAYAYQKIIGKRNWSTIEWWLIFIRNIHYLRNGMRERTFQEEQENLLGQPCRKMFSERGYYILSSTSSFALCCPRIFRLLLEGLPMKF